MVASPRLGQTYYLCICTRRLQRWYWETGQLWASVSVRFPVDLQVRFVASQ